MASRGLANEINGRGHVASQSTNPWSKLMIGGSVGGACAVFTACFVISLLVCRRWLRDRRVARIRRLKHQRRHRTAVATIPSTGARNNSTLQPAECLATRHALPALPTSDLSIPLPANGDVSTESLNWLWNTHPTRPDWSPTLSRQEAFGKSPSPHVIPQRPPGRSMSPYYSDDLTLNMLRHGDTMSDNVWSPTGARLHGDANTRHNHNLSHQHVADVDSAYVHRRGDHHTDLRRVGNEHRSVSGSREVDFNLSQYMIDDNHSTQNDRAQHSRHWPSSRSADAAVIDRKWRRADLVDDPVWRERNTWELTHRSTELPFHLVTGDARDGGFGPAVDSAVDEDVWIPRVRPERRVYNEQNGIELKSRMACGDSFRTTRSSRLSSTRS